MTIHYLLIRQRFKKKVRCCSLGYYILTILWSSSTYILLHGHRFVLHFILVHNVKIKFVTWPVIWSVSYFIHSDHMIYITLIIIIICLYLLSVHILQINVTFLLIHIDCYETYKNTYLQILKKLRRKVIDVDGRAIHELVFNLIASVLKNAFAWILKSSYNILTSFSVLQLDVRCRRKMKVFPMKLWMETSFSR